MAAWTSSDSGLAELRRRWESSPGSHLFLQLAEEYRRRGDFGDAVEVLRRGILANPSLAAEVALGRSLLEGGDPLAAREHLETAVRRDPTQMVAYRHLVETLIQLDEGAEAARCLEIYRQLNARDPDTPDLAARIEELLATSSASGVAEVAPATKVVAPLVSEALDLKSEWQSEASLSETPPPVPGVMILPAGNQPGGFGIAFLGEDEDEVLFILEPTQTQSFDLFSLPCRPLSWKAPSLRNSSSSAPAFQTLNVEATATLGQLYLEQGHVEEAERIYRAVDGGESSDREDVGRISASGDGALSSVAEAVNQALVPLVSSGVDAHRPQPGLAEFLPLSSLRTRATKVARRRLFLEAYLNRISGPKRHVS